MKEKQDPTFLLHLAGRFYDRQKVRTREWVDQLLEKGTPVVIYPIVLEQRVYVWDEYKVYLPSTHHYQGGRALGLIKSIINEERGIVGVLYDDQDDIVEERLTDIRIDEKNTPVPEKEKFV